MSHQLSAISFQPATRPRKNLLPGRQPIPKLTAESRRLPFSVRNLDAEIQIARGGGRSRESFTPQAKLGPRPDARGDRHDDLVDVIAAGEAQILLGAVAGFGLCDEEILSQVPAALTGSQSQACDPTETLQCSPDACQEP
jgi:hypothetical protein